MKNEPLKLMKTTQQQISKPNKTLIDAWGKMKSMEIESCKIMNKYVELKE